MRKKCYRHPEADAICTCSKCGKDLCARCKVDYHGKAICADCGMPLIGFLSGMHGDPRTEIEHAKQ